MPITIRNCTRNQFFYTGGINDVDLSVGNLLPLSKFMNRFCNPLGRDLLLPGGMGRWSPWIPGLGKNFAVYTCASGDYHEAGAMTVKVTTADAVLYVVALVTGATAILSEQTFTSTNLSADLNPYAHKWREVVPVRPTHGVYSQPAGAHHSQGAISVRPPAPSTQFHLVQGQWVQLYPTPSGVPGGSHPAGGQLTPAQQSKFGSAALILKIGYWIFNAARAVLGDPTVWVEGALVAEFGPCVAEQVLQFFGDAASFADVLQNIRSLASAFQPFVQTVVECLRRLRRPDAANLMAEAGAINHLFLEFDTNDDGYISRGEFNAFAKYFLRLQDPLDVSRVFAIFDTNDDHRISPDEWARNMTALVRPEGALRAHLQATQGAPPSAPPPPPPSAQPPLLQGSWGQHASMPISTPSSVVASNHLHGGLHTPTPAHLRMIEARYQDALLVAARRNAVLDGAARMNDLLDGEPLAGTIDDNTEEALLAEYLAGLGTIDDNS